MEAPANRPQVVTGQRYKNGTSLASSGDPSGSFFCLGVKKVTSVIGSAKKLATEQAVCPTFTPARQQPAAPSQRSVTSTVTRTTSTPSVQPTPPRYSDVTAGNARGVDARPPERLAKPVSAVPIGRGEAPLSVGAVAPRPGPSNPPAPSTSGEDFFMIPRSQFLGLMNEWGRSSWS